MHPNAGEKDKSTLTSLLECLQNTFINMVTILTLVNLLG